MIGSNRRPVCVKAGTKGCLLLVVSDEARVHDMKQQVTCVWDNGHGGVCASQ